MNFYAVLRAPGFRRILVLVGLLSVSLLCRVSISAATDSNLVVTIMRANPNLVLNWFGSNAVAYQVESSTNLNTWNTASTAMKGSGGLLSFSTPFVGQGGAFFRVRRMSHPELISATYNGVTGILTITGDDLANSIVVSRNPAGTILVNGGAVAVQGGTPTVANTVLIEIFGREDNDQLSLNEANGALPNAHLLGEAGNDLLIGGSGADVLE